MTVDYTLTGPQADLDHINMWLNQQIAASSARVAAAAREQARLQAQLAAELAAERAAIARRTAERQAAFERQLQRWTSAVWGLPGLAGFLVIAGLVGLGMPWLVTGIVAIVFAISLMTGMYCWQIELHHDAISVHRRTSKPQTAHQTAKKAAAAAMNRPG